MKGKIMAIWDTFRHGGAAREKIRQVVPQPIRQDLRNLRSGNLDQRIGGAMGLAGTALRLPEFGVSEAAGKAVAYDAFGNPINKNSSTPSSTTPTDTESRTRVGDIDFGSTTTSGGGTGTTQADIDTRRAEIQKRLDSARAQIEGIYNRDMTDLDTQYNKAKKEGEQAYADMGRGIDQQNIQQTRALDNFFTGRGLGDSSYRETANVQANQEFRNALMRLSENEAQYYGDLDTQVNRAKEELNRVKANFYNELPNFGSMEEAIGYASQLQDQEQALTEFETELRKQVTQMAQAQPYKTAENMMNVSNMLTQIASSGGTSQDKLRRADQVVGAYFTDPKAREYYMDQFGFMMAQANNDVDAMRRMEEQLKNKYY